LNKEKAKPLRVALVISGRTVSEYSIFLRHLLIGFADESIQAALICPPGVDVDSVLCGAVEVIRHPAVDLPLAERFSRSSAARRLAEFGPVVLHCLCQSKASPAAWLGNRLNLPCVLTVNSLQKRRGPLARSARQCARIAAPTRSIAESIARLHPRLADRVEHINVGAFVAETGSCFSHTSRIATIVVSHPFDRVDDFENLLSAVRHMKLDGYEFMTLLMGGGRGESKVRELLNALDLLSTVTVVPKITPCRSVLAAGDIFVRPRPSDSFDPFLLEAMSVGLAVAACTGGVDDLIVEDSTAAVFDADDELSIMNTLKQLLGKRELARKIAGAGQDYVRQHHSVSDMVCATLQAYREAGDWHKAGESGRHT